MPSTRTICYYAMYVIGEVESNWNWTSVNYNDPITIGMMQWYGTRAAALLNRVKTETPDAYPMLAQSLRDSLESQSADSSYWTRRYLNTEEGTSIVNVFAEEENHIVQESQAIADFEGYIDMMVNSWGFSESYPKPLIFCMAMYHQSPRQCGFVVNSCGGSADLDLIYSTCMNDPVLSIYKNRYNTVYNRLKEWDGESDPPDFGQVGTIPNEGGNNPTIDGQEANKVGYIISNGENLVLYGDNDTYRSGVVFAKAGAERWIPATNKNGAPITGGNTGGGSTKEGDAIIAYLRSVVDQWTYSNAPSRLDPENSKEADCSSTVWWAYHHIAGIELGTWTGSQSSDGVEIWRGYSASDIPWNDLKAADMILMTGDPNLLWGFNGYYCHIELYTGDGTNIIGSPGGSVPSEKEGIAFIDNYNPVGIMVRRIEELE